MWCGRRTALPWTPSDAEYRYVIVSRNVTVLHANADAHRVKQVVLREQYKSTRPVGQESEAGGGRSVRKYARTKRRRSRVAFHQSRCVENTQILSDGVTDLVLTLLPDRSTPRAAAPTTAVQGSIRPSHSGYTRRTVARMDGAWTMGGVEQRFPWRHNDGTYIYGVRISHSVSIPLLRYKGITGLPLDLRAVDPIFTLAPRGRMDFVCDINVAGWLQIHVRLVSELYGMVFVQKRMLTATKRRQESLFSADSWWADVWWAVNLQRGDDTLYKGDVSALLQSSHRIQYSQRSVRAESWLPR